MMNDCLIEKLLFFQVEGVTSYHSLSPYQEVNGSAPQDKTKGLTTKHLTTNRKQSDTKLKPFKSPSSLSASTGILYEIQGVP